MNWKHCIFIGIVSFGIGVIVGYLLLGYTTFGSVGSLLISGTGIVLAFLAGLLGRSDILGFISNYFKDKKEEKAKQKEKLEGYLRKHSSDLVNGVLSKWFDLRKNLHTLQQDLHIVARTPIAIAIYEPPNNRIIESIEFYNLKSDIWHQAVCHLRAKEYIVDDLQFMNFWLDECETRSTEYLEGYWKVLERIENKVLMTSIPKKFAKWDGKGTHPTSCYILDNTVYWIYQEAKQYMNSGEFNNIFKKDTETERGHIRIGLGELCAISPNEGLADEFIEIVYGIAKDKALTEELKSHGKEEQTIQESVGDFKKELNKIIYDFEKRYYILKCYCDTCKPWVDKLKSLDESYYKQLISPSKT